jgi:F-type H+-transporting ATPase subunit gamma
MAQTLELLTRRTGTMRSIRGIVRTMKTMSAINALPYEQAAQSIEAYRATALRGLHAFVTRNGPLPVDDAADALPVVIVLGSDHGLCGNYNEVVADEAALICTADTHVVCVGAQMEDALIGQGIRPETTLLPPASVDGLGRLAGRLIAVLDGMRSDASSGAIGVSLVFTQRADHAQQHATTQRLLPLDPTISKGFAQKPWQSRSLPQFSLPPDQLLAALIRSYLFAGLYRAAAEAMVTENAARLARMQQAERSVDEQLEDLTGEMRLVRQSEITTELLDVIIGFEALKDRVKRKQAKPDA